MAEPSYTVDQFPTIGSAPRAPHREYARPERVADWESVNSGSLAPLPSRDDRESPPEELSEQIIRVLLVDDHLSFRQPLAFMLRRESDITIIGQAATVEEARPLLPEVDIALIDLDLPDEEGVALIRELLAVNPKAIALVLTGSRSSLAMARAVEAGAVGVLHKSPPVSEVVEAIHRLQAGEPLLSIRETIELLRVITQHRNQHQSVQAVIDQLTPREREVLQALAEGLADYEIAQQLHIRHETVRTHMVNILNKLGVDSRLKALVFALQHGLVTIEKAS